MALKFKFKSKDEVPAEMQNLYVEHDGSWVLDVDGAVEKAKLDEFRTNNLTLIKERDELKQRFDGIDPDAARALLAEKQKAEEERLLNEAEEADPEQAGKKKGGEGQAEPAHAEQAKPERKKSAERERLERVIDARVRVAKAELEKQLVAVAAERDVLTTRLTTVQIDQGVIAAASKRGLRPTAITDITARARAVFRLVNGVPAAFESDGKTMRYGQDKITPMTLEEWVDTQVSEAPHLFESNAGSGGGGATSHYGNASGGGGGRLQTLQKNPFKKETWNLTEQMKLLKNDPQLAARLKAAA